MQLVTIYKTLNPADAELIRSRLETAGFHPFIKDELASLSLAPSGIQVQVPESEAAEVTEFLKSSVASPE